MNPESTPDTIELELKIGLRDCNPTRVSTALFEALGQSVNDHTALLSNEYFDCDGLLHTHGVAIRIRSVDQTHEMTVKIREPDEGGLSQRREWNFPLVTPELDYSRLEQLPLPEPITDCVQKRKLVVVFQNTFERTDWRIVHKGCELMMSLDLGSVRVDKQESVVSELELELISGDVDALVDLGCEISDRLPSYMAVISKAERGDRLIRNAHPMQDCEPVTRCEWLHWLSRALDPLSGPAPHEALRALNALGYAEKSEILSEIKQGDLPHGLTRWMILESLESKHAGG